MAVNISKTKYIIFRTKGKKIDSNIEKVVFNSNEIGKPVDLSQIFELERVYLENPNHENTTYKLLGVYFDEYLNFDKHISYICAKLAKSLFCIKRSYKKLSCNALKNIYHALIHPHLLYCINIMSCTSAKNLNRISKIQKKAVRIITKSKKYEHTGPLLKSIDVLPFDKLMLQSKLLFMHSIHNSYAPNSFKNMFIKNNDRDVAYELRNEGAYVVPAVRIEFFKKFPIYTFPTAWNNAVTLAYYVNKITFQKALREEHFESI